MYPSIPFTWNLHCNILVYASANLVKFHNSLKYIPVLDYISCFGYIAQCSRMHLWQKFFFGLHAYFWKIQVILWCRNPFLEFFYYIDYGFLASYFWHFFLPFCNFYYWKVTNLALIEKKELCRQVWDLF